MGVRVGFIGLGQMGAPMAEHVARTGMDVSVFDVRPEAAEASVAAGATLATTAVEAARAADVVCVVVSTDAQLLDVVSDELVAATADGATLLLHSTVGLDTVREAVRRCEAAGRTCLDVGISGGEFGAQAGTLVLMAGGPADALERVRLVLEAYSSHVFHTGDVGTGMVAKLARNLVGYSMMAAVHDGQVLAEAGGVDLGQFKEILDATNLTMMTDFVAGRTSTTPEPVDVGRHDGMRGLVEIGHKDLAMAHAAAAELGVAVDTAAVAQRAYANVLGLELPIEPGLEIEPGL